MGEYVVDGYNIIFRCKRLRPLLDRSAELARDAFIERLTRFCATTGSTVTLVFDGRTRQLMAASNYASVPNLRIMYSESGQTADSLIERFVYNLPQRRDMIVVSGDMSLRKLCQGLGSLVMGPDNFLETIDSAMEHARTSLATTQQKTPPIRLEDRLDGPSLQRLRDIAQQLKGDK